MFTKVYNKLQKKVNKKVVHFSWHAEKVAVYFSRSLKWTIQEKGYEMMNKVKSLENENIYVVTCFSDRMKFMDRR